LRRVSRVAVPRTVLQSKQVYIGLYPDKGRSPHCRQGRRCEHEGDAADL